MKITNEWNIWNGAEKKEHLKQDDEPNKFIHYNKTNIDTLKISLILLIK